ncbi:MAG: hypothetical protein HZA89_05800 [Verrucomicrobia bacterium]|nr:hypothetical protein [Verrucomicrobiota bacterium]
MNPKRLVIAIIAVFLGIWVTDFLIHGLWLQDTYKATMSLWRTEKEMQGHMGWLMLGQFLAAATFVVLWARGFAEKACIVCAVMYGLFMGLFHSANTLITYAVQPLPGDLAVKWIVAGVAQAVLLGLLVFFVYKPAPKVNGAAE